jgi:pimeloyl-ACP methyl ester carboxylesterase
LLDYLGIERFKAIGMSLGAKTLLHNATQQPNRVEAMVLVSATPYFPEQARAIMRQVSPDNRSEAEWQQMRQWHKHGDEQIRALWRMANSFKDSYDDMNFTASSLSTITLARSSCMATTIHFIPSTWRWNCMLPFLVHICGLFQMAGMVPFSEAWRLNLRRRRWRFCVVNGHRRRLICQRSWDPICRRSGSLPAGG